MVLGYHRRWELDHLRAHGRGRSRAGAWRQRFGRRWQERNPDGLSEPMRDSRSWVSGLRSIVAEPTLAERLATLLAGDALRRRSGLYNEPRMCSDWRWRLGGFDELDRDDLAATVPQCSRGRVCARPGGATSTGTAAAEGGREGIRPRRSLRMSPSARHRTETARVILWNAARPRVQGGRATHGSVYYARAAVNHRPRVGPPRPL